MKVILFFGMRMLPPEPPSGAPAPVAEEEEDASGEGVVATSLPHATARGRTARTQRRDFIKAILFICRALVNYSCLARADSSIPRRRARTPWVVHRRP